MVKILIETSKNRRKIRPNTFIYAPWPWYKVANFKLLIHLRKSESLVVCIYLVEFFLTKNILTPVSVNSVYKQQYKYKILQESINSNYVNNVK